MSEGDSKISAETRRRLTALAALLKQGAIEFGKFGQVRDIQALCAASSSAPDFPPGISFEDYERLETTASWDRRGFGMVHPQSGGSWNVVLTPKGEGAVTRMMAAYTDALEAEPVAEPGRGGAP